MLQPYHPKTSRPHGPSRNSLRQRGCGVLLFLIVVLCALTTRADTLATEAQRIDETGALRITHVGLVAADTIALTLHAGRIVYGKHIPYSRQRGDRIVGRFPNRWVYRRGEYIGSLVGRDGQIVYGPDQFIGDVLPEVTVDRNRTYVIRSVDDERYSRGDHPVAVSRKTKPSDIGWTHEDDTWVMPTESVVYMRLPAPLTEGKTYWIETALRSVAPISFVYNPQSLRSNAVHVSHVGFHPHDPAKVAFLSTWMGSGGPISYPEGLKFSVIDVRTGEVVFTGHTRLSKSRGEAEDASGRNYNGADVYEMDFHSLDKEGEYFVVVDGIGRSYPFPIDRNVWQRAFTVSARGFYHQRSGIELGPPYTSYVRPRPFNPEDGVIIHRSTCPLMESKNGLNYSGRDKDRFTCIRDGKQDMTVTNAWGGYMDAGDWDRRIQHLRVSRYLLELANLFPERFATLSLNIPESGDGLPDIISEALFNLDFYRRMQHADGGIPGGIESAEHPRRGERSWEESLDIMAYAPDVWSSHWYAATAARAAYVLRTLSPDRADVYKNSALRAMDYAEKEWRRLGKPHAQSNGVIDARNMAAAELYRLTGDNKWQAIFKETTVLKDGRLQLYHWPDFDQSESAWVYLRTKHPNVDEPLQQICRQAILAEADAKTAQVYNTGFRWTKNPWAAAAWGYSPLPMP